MAIFLHPGLPAYTRLAAENLVRPATEAVPGKTLRVALLNLMPTTLATEYQFARLLAKAGLDTELILARMTSHQAHNAPAGHLERWYRPSSELRQAGPGSLDAVIVTGAPVEHLPFEQVDYWQELADSMAWIQQAGLPAVYVCWASQAALWLRFGIGKQSFPEKLSGVFTHHSCSGAAAFAAGLPASFAAPHSRHTGFDEAAIRRTPGLEQLACLADTSAVPAFARGASYLLVSDGGKSLYISGHPEYEAETLDAEYRRDRGRDPAAAPPWNYYADRERLIIAKPEWTGAAQAVYTAWLGYVQDLKNGQQEQELHTEARKAYRHSVSSRCFL